ncbi:hypothetical protein GCM10007414_28580 [Agarivorans gilvus]|uniref:Uncharacterized protein n=1 Tax=Agarivorans gilvus TaxID=680279 RepID=A0ABQ1I3P1_9ALTE|nr:hypothetical protein GCM10007414_28580 [Agarivorans gilvus]
MGKVARLLAAFVGLWLANAQAEPLRLVYPDFPPIPPIAKLPKRLAISCWRKSCKAWGKTTKPV